MSQYFLGPYLQEKLYEHGVEYDRDSVGELFTFRYDSPDGPVQLWQHAFDLRDLRVASDDSSNDELSIICHYTNELAFQNVANLDQTAAELFASLAESQAHFGKGVYGTQHEPAVWGSQTRILLNNYRILRADPGTQSNGIPHLRRQTSQQKRSSKGFDTVEVTSASLPFGIDFLPSFCVSKSTHLSPPAHFHT